MTHLRGRTNEPKSSHDRSVPTAAVNIDSFTYMYSAVRDFIVLGSKSNATTADEIIAGTLGALAQYLDSQEEEKEENNSNQQKVHPEDSKEEYERLVQE
eukprot:CAMPEP_0172467282 /NCGR_PEP_ID=MMETSP1065-20121228/58434_1 /TAXON_ID=265537 /ORGANISM="Amphiprora paludosa, Strain CCMP125" /LENGTH=98 /DNA_ID=CAMNT_0013224379 /DNA_START=21 /DNA_END=317 /DNA_ORIENTATION=-